MGFIKDAVIGIMLYEWIKRRASRHRSCDSEHPSSVTIGGKVYRRDTNHGNAIASYRHHLDRPEMGTE